MKKNTQKAWILKQLRENGRITRNECLKNFISRLGARISDLKEEGWNIEGEFIKTPNGKDYVYTLADDQRKKEQVVVHLPNGAVRVEYK